MYDGLGPELTVDPVSAVVQGMTFVARRWRARLNERLKIIDQTDARFAALAEISAEPNGLVQRELSRRLGVEEPTIVRLVDALEAQGWVERFVHGDDRRAKIVRATPAAAPALDEAHVIVTGMRCELFADIDPLDLLACTRVIDELSRKLQLF
jgi:MarR family transcriptional regulator for hemolysin